MKPFFGDKYLIGFLFVYCAAVALLYFMFQQPLGNSLPVALFFGIGFPLIAWLLVRNLVSPRTDKPAFKNETVVLAALVLFIIWYITYGTGWINSLAPKSILSIPWRNDVFILIKKLIVFVLAPFLVYKAFGFGAADFGLTVTRQKSANRSVILVFVVLSLLALVFQYTTGHGAEPLRKGQFTPMQLLIGVPLAFAWYFAEAGLVEEFFFRALLQSRIAVLLRSNTAGILISGLIFGLAHAPGLYLRGAGSEGITEQLPFIFWAAYTISVMSLAGIFLGIVWSRTKNIWLVMAIHAMVDLLPNLPDFIHDWHIG